MTLRQKQVLAFCLRFLRDNERFPKYSEVCDVFGWRSTHSVTTVFKALAKKGFLVKKKVSYRLAENCPCCGGRLAA
jgi:SOS-response transcriptional repressor LexA